jgi:hypothetical protein
LVDDGFNAELSARVHGRFEVSGSSRLAVDVLDPKRRQGVSMHEHVHAELSDNSTYGLFQRRLLLASHFASGDLRARARDVFDATFAAAQQTHEGFASLREYAWVAANEGSAAAATYVEGLPNVYRDGMERCMALVGDPSDEAYDGSDAQGFHITLTGAGLFIMNSPLLSAYPEPDSVFDPALPWIGIDGPDERLRALEPHSETIRRCVREWRLVAELWTPANGIDALIRVWDEMAKSLREVIPAWQVVMRAEAIAEAEMVKPAWLRVLGQTPLPASHGGGTRDVTEERALEREHERMNSGPHEGEQIPWSDLPLDTFVTMHEAGDPSGVARLIMFGTVPADLPSEFLPDCELAASSLPMWVGSAGAGSPLVRFLPAFTVTARMTNLLARSEEVTCGLALWYTHHGLMRQIRRKHLPLAGTRIEKCGSPRQLLGAAKETSQDGSTVTYDWFTFEDSEIAYEYVLAVTSSTTFSFTLSDHVTMEAFKTAARAQGLERSKVDTLLVGQREIHTRTVARIARWGLVGN